jgi:spermidine/putrescine transport system permease protein
MVSPGISVDLLYTYPAIVIGLVHAYMPYLVLTCYVTLQGIDDALVEAARSMGASRLQTFLRVILPLSLPGVIAGSVLTFVPVTGSFMEARILGGQQGIMFGTLIENQFTASFDWPLGAALGFVLLAMLLIIMALFFPLLRRHLVA